MTAYLWNHQAPSSVQEMLCTSCFQTIACLLKLKEWKRIPVLSGLTASFFVMSDTTLSFWQGIAAIFQVRTSDFSFLYCKERYMTVYLLGSSLAHFKKCHQLCYNYCVFLWVQIKNENILLLVIAACLFLLL